MALQIPALVQGTAPIGSQVSAGRRRPGRRRGPQAGRYRTASTPSIPRRAPSTSAATGLSTSTSV